MLLTKYYDMVGAFSAYISVKPFDEWIMPRTVVSRNHFVYAHRFGAPAKPLALDAVTIPKKISRRSVPRKGFHDLLRRPSSRRVFGDIEVNDPAACMAQDNKHVQQAKPNCGDHEEIDGDHFIHMVLDESSPGLRGRFSTASMNELGHGSFGYVDAKFEKLAMDRGGAPQWIRLRHLQDNGPNFRVERWPAAFSSLRFPAPIEV